MDRGWYVRFLIVLVSAVVAVLVLWPSMSTWVPAPTFVKNTFKAKISPGLDIQGGLRLMYEVEVDEAVRDRRDRLSESLLEQMGRELKILEGNDAPTREQLSKVRQRVQIQRVGERRIRATFDSAGDAAKLSRQFLRDKFPDLREVDREGNTVTLAIRDEQLKDLREKAVEQAVRVISERIDELQIRETTVIGRETDIIVEIPGADQAMFERIRSIISRTARLDFQVLDDENATGFFDGVGQLPAGIEKQTEVTSAGEQNPQVASTYLVARGADARRKLQAFVDTLHVADDHEVVLGRLDSEDDDLPAAGRREEAWRTYYLFASSEVTGEDIKDAFVTFDQQENNKPVVALHFNNVGATRFEQLTGRNVKRRMAIVLDERVQSAPVIQARIGGGRAQITMGSYLDYNKLLGEANDLVIVLRAGALPAPIRPSNEQLIGPTLGRDSVKKGAEGALIGILLVLVFMAVYYQVAGVVADLMVMLNILFLLAILAALEATLTLPGIAGIALTVGMAVDANVLITERIREELRLGKSPRAAVDHGFKRAFWSIFDGQITTFIAGVVLFEYGSGPLKGFAVTLMIGIFTSLFTGVFCSRVMLDWIVRGLRVQRLKVG